MAAMKEFNLPAEKVNVHGGACALGHPVGASGARIIATLINAMYKYEVKKGIATLCIGGGEATAMARSEEHTSELQSLMRISYAVFCLKKKKHNSRTPTR